MVIRFGPGAISIIIYIDFMLKKEQNDHFATDIDLSQHWFK